MPVLDTPFQYVDRFHQLRVFDPDLKLDVTAHLYRYVNGWDPSEGQEVIRRLKGHGNGYKETGGFFQLTARTDVDPNEQFLTAGVLRAFAGRGSPAECQAALRLAVMAGQTTAARAQAYAERCFGQDCNSFAGNYLGLCPIIAIGAYVTGYTEHDLSPRDKTRHAVMGYLPFPPRADVKDVRQGDVLVTFGPPADPPSRSRWRHIGIVQDFRVTGGGSEEGGGTVWTADAQIAQWGAPWADRKAIHPAGNETMHKSTAAKLTVVQDVLAWKPAGAHAKWAGILAALKGVVALKKKTVTAVLTVYDGSPAFLLVLNSFDPATGRGHLFPRGLRCGLHLGV